MYLLRVLLHVRPGQHACHGRERLPIEPVGGLGDAQLSGHGVRSTALVQPMCQSDDPVMAMAAMASYIVNWWSNYSNTGRETCVSVQSPSRWLQLRWGYEFGDKGDEGDEADDERVEGWILCPQDQTACRPVHRTMDADSLSQSLHLVEWEAVSLHGVDGYSKPPDSYHVLHVALVFYKLSRTKLRPKRSDTNDLKKWSKPISSITQNQTNAVTEHCTSGYHACVTGDHGTCKASLLSVFFGGSSFED